MILGIIFLIDLKIMIINRILNGIDDYGDI